MKRFIVLFFLMTLSLVIYACGPEDVGEDLAPTFSHLIVDGRDPVVDGAQETYTVDKGDEVVVEVFIDNPTAAPINSVTINGQTYRTNRFEEGTTAQRIVLHLRMPVPGEIAYEVQSFLHSDNVTVSVTENNLFNVFVRKTVPTASLTNLTSTTDSLSMEIRIFDEDQVVLDNRTEILLYQGETLIDSQTLQRAALNAVTFDGLMSDQTYQIIVLTDYDLDDGEGVVEGHTLLERDDLTTRTKDTPTASVHFNAIHQTSVDFSVQVTDNFEVIDWESFVVNILLDGAVVHTMDDLTPTTLSNIFVDGLLNNNTYTVELRANYDLNDGEGLREDVLLFTGSFNTPPAEAPSMNASLLTITQSTMVIDLIDGHEIDGIPLNNVRIKLYHIASDTLLRTIPVQESQSTIEIIDLMANNDYLVEIYADFDLGDGQGEQSRSVFNDTYRTLSNAKPSATIGAIDVTQTTVSFNTSVSNPNQTMVNGTFTARLYADDVLIDTLVLPNASGTYTFTGLTVETGVSYTITLKTSYDLRDGEGVFTDLFLASRIKTILVPLVPEISFEVTADQENIDGTVTVIDSDNVLTVYTVELYLGETLIDSLTDTSPFNFSGLLSDNTYTVKVVYSYDLNDGEGTQTGTVESTITTEAKESPTVGIEDLDADQESIEGTVSFTDTDNALTEYTVELYLGDTLIDSLTDTSPFNFSGLLSDNTYTVKVVYSYDLNDGEGTQAGTVESTITTEAQAVPLFELDLTSELLKVEGDITVVDVDNVVDTYSVHLYLDDSLVDTISDTSLFSFTNLTMNTGYVVRLVYTYDLNDGEGLQSITIEDSIETKMLTANVSLSNINQNSMVVTLLDGHEVEGIILENVHIRVYHESTMELIKTIPIQKPDTTIEIIDLLSDNAYLIEIIADFDLGAGDGVQTDIIYQNTFKTTTNAKPTATIGSISFTQTTITFNTSISNPNQTLQADSFTARLYEDDVLIATIVLPNDSGTYRFTGLQVSSDASYTITLKADYDLRDGEGVVEDLFLASRVKSILNPLPPSGEILEVVEDENGIWVYFNVNDFDDAIIDNGLLLELGSSRFVVDDFDVPFNITNYLNGTNYELRLIVVAELVQANQLTEVELTLDTVTLTTSSLTPPRALTVSVPAKDRIQGTLSILDEDNVLIDYKIELYLDDSYIDSVENTAAFNFTGLLSNTQYRLRFVYTYDLNDGEGERTSFSDTMLPTLPLSEPELSLNVNSGQTRVYGSVVGLLSDLDDTLDGYTVELYREGVMVDSVEDVSMFDFTGLLSNREYQVRIIYRYDLNDGQGMQTVASDEMLISTNALTDPNIGLNITADQVKVEGSLVISDMDDTLTSYTVELILGGTVVDTVEDLSAFTFTDVFSNKTYQVRVVYRYDLNDGQGERVVVGDASSITTDAQTVPSATLSLDSNQTEIDGVVSIADTDNVLIDYTVELYLNGTLIDSVDDVSDFTFSGLLSDTAYQVRIVYRYDLNDGEGTQISSVQSGIVTVSQASPVIEITNITHELFSISVHYTLNDVDDVLVQGYDLVLYEGDTEIERITANGSGFVTFTNVDQSTTYRIEVEAEIDLNTINGSEVTKLFETETTSPSYNPQVTISDTAILQERINFRIDADDMFSVLDDSMLRIEVRDASDLIVGDSMFIENGLKLNVFNLWSNYEYTFHIYAQVDYDDGQGVQEVLVFTEKITTSAKAIPSASLGTMAVDGDDVTFTVTGYSNPDNVTFELRAVLYEDGVEIAQMVINESGSYSFDDVYDGGSRYTIRLYIDYDVNDSKGLIEDVHIDSMSVIIADKNE